MWAHLPGTGSLDWGAQGEVETTSSSGGTSATEISLQILNPHTWVQGSHFCISTSPASLNGLLLCILSDKTSAQLAFRWLFRLIVLCNLVVILMWFLEEVSVTSTYSAILDPP